MNVSFIGSGNLAWHLAPAFDNAGFTVKEVYSRNHRHAEALTGRLYQAEVKASLDFSTSGSTVFIIAVNDDSISAIAREIVLPEDAVLAHTSGSVPLIDLQFAATSNVGVFYPLQTFSKTKKIDFKSTPIFVESNNEETESILLDMAKAITGQARVISSEERKALHVAAVFASNFTNHMLALSQKVMQENSLEFDWLKPLIVETINKSLHVGPEAAQTGPAKRGDLETLEKHMAFLQSDPELSELYKIISQHIINLYHED
ncbi:MAG TPA: DUF2520 domain-containing protein [Cyclobacteriaceae bacterium]|jgi:predicted short-subunit dehydrogenase-like oxidoreductase (DUF2520 family)|nr:DUF2520 domain-containing protein [Cyclobacteriaceae bacterium]